MGRPCADFRVAPVIVAARNPIQEYCEQMAAKAALRLSRAKVLGEAIMREVLSLIVAAATFVDAGSLGFLVNPRTHEQMVWTDYTCTKRWHSSSTANSTNRCRAL